MLVVVPQIQQIDTCIYFSLIHVILYILTRLIRRMLPQGTIPPQDYTSEIVLKKLSQQYELHIWKDRTILRENNSG